jgi:hypothetical protein
MKSKRLFTAIGNIDDMFINEDQDTSVQLKNKNRSVTTFSSWVKPAASLAACLIVAIGIFGIMHGASNGETPILSENPAPSIPENPAAIANVYMNAISDNTNPSARMVFAGREELWSWDEAVEYLGKDITTEYLMPGLKTNPYIPDREQMVIIGTDDEFYGEVIYDVIWLEYYTEYPYEDGSQAIGGDSTGIRILASKRGFFYPDIYVWGADTQETLLNSVPVKFGHSRMGYGGTNENPDFYYDVYVAEFEHDGISFHVISSNINEGEFVKMVESLTAK